MTVPHDEQPLTRRALRELERQKPRKQQKEDAKAADEADAQRRADGAGVPSPAAIAAPVEAPAASAVEPDSSSSSASSAAESESPAVELGSPAVGPEAAAPAAPSGVVEAVPFAPSGTPALSRRARRALSTDHPLAEQHAADQQAADEKLAAEQHAAEQRAAIERTNAGLPDAGTATGPIIAELIHEGPDSTGGETRRGDTDSIEVVETGAVDTHGASGGDGDAAASVDDTSEVVVPVVEELIVIDDAVDPEVASQEDEEFAEIDDTVAPEAVHVITIDENPSGPILSPLFPAQGAAAAERGVDRPRPTDSSFDSLVASRGVGSSNSVATTSALVLPSVPNHGDVGTALDETGEVIITGSIDLPMSLGSMGSAPSDGLESSELDAYLDPDGDVGSDVAPVSATRAVSTHGSSSGLIAPPKRSRANAPVVLAVVAGVLAIGVIGLIVAVVAFRII